MLIFLFKCNNAEMHSQKSFSRFFCDASVPLPNRQTIKCRRCQLNCLSVNQSISHHYCHVLVIAGTSEMHSQKCFSLLFCDASVPIPNRQTMGCRHCQLNSLSVNQSSLLPRPYYSRDVGRTSYLARLFN